MESYDLAQICINGHVINSRASKNPVRNKNFCEQCGAETITSCKHCNTPIKGESSNPTIAEIRLGYKIPKFCDNCGNPFPWTQIKLKAASELVHLSSDLSSEEKDDFNINIVDLVNESPNIPAAQIKVKKYLGKVGKDVAQGIRDILVDLISETVKRAIWNQ